ncbi:MAG: hypothetical protein ACRDCZ_03200 [Culicoidibacterales bacterium]
MMNNKKIKKDSIVVSAVLIATISSSLIGYLALTNTLQLWQTFLQYLADGQIVSFEMFVTAVWQNVGLQLFTPALAVFGCVVIAQYVLAQTDFVQARLKSFWFGVVTLMLGSLMLIFFTPQYVVITSLLFIVPGLLALFLSMESPTVTNGVAFEQQAVKKNSRVATKKHYRRYLRK